MEFTAILACILVCSLYGLTVCTFMLYSVAEALSELSCIRTE